MIRKATIEDVKAIYDLLQIYGLRGELIGRPLSELYDHVRDFAVYEDKQTGTITGCCALQFCWEALAEIRSLAVHPDHTGQSIGTQLAQNALKEALTFNIKEVFTLTYRPRFFNNLGFAKIDRADLPIKIWKDCLLCVKYPDCDETAMMKTL